jgi:hypothetical protein
VVINGGVDEPVALARGGVLVAADRLAGGPVQVGQAADAAADQDGMHGGGGQPGQPLIPVLGGPAVGGWVG